MQNVVDALDGAFRDARFGQVALDELDVRNVIEIAALAGDQTIEYADLMPAANQFFGEM
jgi:hypothetical protein